MAINAQRKGNQLVLTIDLAEKPYRSKSAIAKAQKEWDKAKHPDGATFDPNSVAATMLATTGGFIREGDVKVSLNVTTA